MTEWESVSSPRSAAFIGWGNKEGQHVTGQVTHVGIGSKPKNAGPCPELTIELTEAAHSFRKGEWATFDPGTTVTLTCAQYQLERDIQAAQLTPGDLVKITLQGVTETRNGNTVKDFDVKIARGAAPVAPAPQQPAFNSAPAQQPSFDQGMQPTAPF